ncbi:hypothetical protein GCM10019060_25640 [Novosphingobium pokkalii]|nr:hypothetical protein GCM10019060_25640 [Novosphingobium pokkalii]
MIVDDFDIVSVSVLPDETYAPLHVNGNGMLACAIAAQGVKAVGWRVAQVVECACAVEHAQFVQGSILDFAWQFAATLAVPDFLGFETRKVKHLPVLTGF